MRSASIFIGRLEPSSLLQENQPGVAVIMRHFPLVFSVLDRALLRQIERLSSSGCRYETSIACLRAGNSIFILPRTGYDYPWASLLEV